MTLVIGVRKEKSMTFINQVSKYHEMISEINKDSEDSSFFHYTTVEVMDHILSDACFWASNIYYLNDAKEYYSGIQYLDRLFDSATADNTQIQKLLNNIKYDDGKSSLGIFSISFSKQEDNLHQWITYSKESGICLELDRQRLKFNKENMRSILCYRIKGFDRFSKYCNTSVVLCPIKYADTNEPDINKDTVKGIIECFALATVNVVTNVKSIYDSNNPNKYNSIFLTEAKKINNTFDSNPKVLSNGVDENLIKIWESKSEQAKSFLRLLASYYKMNAFSEESEYRAAFLPCEYPEEVEIKYAIRKNGIIRPYIEIAFQKSAGKFGNCETALPIKSIMVGPSGNQQAVFDSVVHRVKYGKMKVWCYEGDELERKREEYIIGSIERYKCDYPEEDIENIKSKIIDQLLNERDECDDVHVQKVVKSIKQSNYFSKEGIWIKKSKIPYIF